jgi:LmbE family N-acetylglucosaminyl deacetylase
MGLFNRKSSQDRQEEALQMADDIAAGRGFMGKMTKAFMGSEFTEAMQQATSSIHQAEHVAALRAAGVPTQTATVLGMQDTGQTINDNPSIVLTLQLGAQAVAVQALVSRLEIPRVGEQVLVMNDPQSGGLLYAGLAPRA